MDKKLFIGLDVGTDSVGWAVTDEDYNLYRIKGKTAWGARIFDAAESAAGRRQTRVARRRLQRRKRRVLWLEQIFAEEMAKTDPSFFIRLHHSALHNEDKPKEAQSQCPIFPTKKQEKEFYKRYPTIWHLRYALVSNDDQAYSDIRLLYLAIHHIIKYRGNFLREGNVDVKQFQLEDLDHLNDYFKKLTNEDGQEFILLDKQKFKDFQAAFESDENKITRKKALLSLLNVTSKDPFFPLADMFCTMATGSPYDTKKLGENYESKKMSFADGKFDDNLPAYEKILGDHTELLLLAKALYDYRELKFILRNRLWLSEAFADIYESHKADLAALKDIVRTIDEAKAKNLFTTIFEDPSNKNNYAALVHVRTNEKRDGSTLKEFYKLVKESIEPNVDVLSEAQQKEWANAKAKMDEESYLRTIAERSTSLIPMQLHEKELIAILQNAKARGMEFFAKNEQKILELFRFKIPYYYGPFAGEHSNLQFKEGAERVPLTPWNYKDQIDDAKTKEKFMTSLTNKCTYLHYADVLPRNSLLFEEFDTYNKINGTKVNGISITAEVRAILYGQNGVFYRPSMKIRAIQKLLRDNLEDQKITFTGLSEADGLTNPSHAFFLKPPFSYDLSSRFNKDYETAEEIIKLFTMFVDNPKDALELADQRFHFTPEQKKALKSFKASGWCSVSKELLTLPSVDNDGEIGKCLIDVLHDDGKPFMYILNDDEYHFLETIDMKNQEKFGAQGPKKQIEDLLEDTPPSMRRPIIQAMRIVDEIVKFSKKRPDAISVEVAREVGDPKKKNQYTDDRKATLDKFFKNLTDHYEAEQKQKVLEELKSERITKDMLRGKHLYLYFLQNGRDAYTGKPIDINDVLNSTKYDTDHIIPQSFIKDDSLDNLVLVERELNQKRNNQFPVPVDREHMKPLWDKLRKAGMMSDKKYFNLMRTTPLTEEELSGFVSAQMNVLNRANKRLIEILKIKYPEAKSENQEGTRYIYSKSAYPSRVRKWLSIPKIRDLNDTHHAVDAYLNIFTGVELTKRFGDMATIKAMAKKALESTDEETKMSMNLERFLWRKVIAYNKETEVSTVKPLGIKIQGISQRHDMLLTYRVNYADAEFYGQMMHKNTKKSLIPLHQKENSPFLCMSKYGGYSGEVAEFNILATVHGKQNKRLVVPVPHHLSCGKSHSEIFSILKKQLQEQLKKTVTLDEKHLLFNNSKVIRGKNVFLFTNLNEGHFVLKPCTPFFLCQEDLEYLSNFGKMKEKHKQSFISEFEHLEIQQNRKGTNSFCASKDRNTQILLSLIKEAKKERYQGISMIGQIAALEGAGESQTPSIFDGKNLSEQYETLLSIIALFGRKSKALCTAEELKTKAFVKGRGSLFDAGPVRIVYDSVTGLVSKVEEL